MTDWSKYAPAPVPYDPANDDAEFERGLGKLPVPQPQPGPQLSDDEEFQRALGQSGVDWSKVGTDSPPSHSGVATDWSKIGTNSPSGNPTAQDYAAMPWSQVVEKGVNNLLPSAWNSIKSVPSAIYNYRDTASAIKQELWQMAGEQSGKAADALKSVHAGVRQAIGNASPQYNTLMGGYQRILDDLQDVTKSAGAGDRTAATTQLQRLVRAQKTPEGQTLISRLGERDPTIPYMLAGSALHDTLAGGVSGATEKLSAPFHMLNIGRALATGDASEIGSALALPVMQGTVQSPRVMGALNYGAGYTAGKIGQSLPVKAAMSLTGPWGSAATTNLSRTERDVPSMIPARATGGAVKKPTHEQLLARFTNLVEQAKRAEQDQNKAPAQRS